MFDSRRVADVSLRIVRSEHEHLLPWYLLQEEILQHSQRRGALQCWEVEISSRRSEITFPFNFSLKSEAYEKSLTYQLSVATVLKNSDVSPCEEKFWPESGGNTGNILFISMSHSKDFTTWLALAKCLHVWDLDARGYHKGLWRLHYHQSPLFIVGVPFSPYS